MTDEADYPLGYSEQEARRLTEQAALLEELTAAVFQRAGISVGMTVLDIGCGVGDVSLLAARLVGPQGAVLGIDRAASSVETARRRASALGMDNARFEQADLASFDPRQSFDALLGRLVLLYLDDPADTLRRLSRYLRLIERTGIATAAEIDIESLALRLRADALAHERVMFLPRVVGAWTMIPEQHELATR